MRNAIRTQAKRRDITATDHRASLPTKSIRADHVSYVIDCITSELKRLGVTGNEAADMLDMPRASFHAFMGKYVKRPSPKTISYLTHGLFWDQHTKQAIAELATFGERLKAGTVKKTPYFRMAGEAALVDDACVNFVSVRAIG